MSAERQALAARLRTLDDVLDLRRSDLEIIIAALTDDTARRLLGELLEISVCECDDTPILTLGGYHDAPPCPHERAKALLGGVS